MDLVNANTEWDVEVVFDNAGDIDWQATAELMDRLHPPFPAGIAGLAADDLPAAAMPGATGEMAYPVQANMPFDLDGQATASDFPAFDLENNDQWLAMDDAELDAAIEAALRPDDPDSLFGHQGTVVDAPVALHDDLNIPIGLPAGRALPQGTEHELIDLTVDRSEGENAATGLPAAMPPPQAAVDGPIDLTTTADPDEIDLAVDAQRWGRWNPKAMCDPGYVRRDTTPYDLSSPRDVMDYMRAVAAGTAWTQGRWGTDAAAALREPAHVWFSRGREMLRCAVGEEGHRLDLLSEPLRMDMGRHWACLSDPLLCGRPYSDETITVAFRALTAWREVEERERRRTAGVLPQGHALQPVQAWNRGQAAVATAA